MSTEGWGGDAPKLHYCSKGRALCGRTASWFSPTIDERYNPNNLPRQRELYCRFCVKIRLRSAVDELLAQVFPDGLAEIKHAD